MSLLKYVLPAMTAVVSCARTQPNGTDDDTPDDKTQLGIGIGFSIWGAVLTIMLLYELYQCYREQQAPAPALPPVAQHEEEIEPPYHNFRAGA